MWWGWQGKQEPDQNGPIGRVTISLGLHETVPWCNFSLAFSHSYRPTRL